MSDFTGGTIWLRGIESAEELGRLVSEGEITWLPRPEERVEEVEEE